MLGVTVVGFRSFGFRVSCGFRCFSSFGLLFRRCSCPSFRCSLSFGSRPPPLGSLPGCFLLLALLLFSFLRGAFGFLSLLGSLPGSLLLLRSLLRGSGCRKLRCTCSSRSLSGSRFLTSAGECSFPCGFLRSVLFFSRSSLLFFLRRSLRCLRCLARSGTRCGFCMCSALGCGASCCILQCALTLPTGGVESPTVAVLGVVDTQIPTFPRGSRLSVASAGLLPMRTIQTFPHLRRGMLLPPL
mmetsp:Transcript_16714/g.36962  ORF Transcript_16714/g.36962 Transcript_16714/m.36962 type:complete len:242 (-) Transcript_16714:220-945(-)